LPSVCKLTNSALAQRDQRLQVAEQGRQTAARKQARTIEHVAFEEILQLLPARLDNSLPQRVNEIREQNRSAGRPQLLLDVRVDPVGVLEACSYLSLHLVSLGVPNELQLAVDVADLCLGGRRQEVGVVVLASGEQREQRAQIMLLMQAEEPRTLLAQPLDVRSVRAYLRVRHRASEPDDLAEWRYREAQQKRVGEGKLDPDHSLTDSIKEQMPASSRPSRLPSVRRERFAPARIAGVNRVGAAEIPLSMRSFAADLQDGEHKQLDSLLRTVADGLALAPGAHAHLASSPRRRGVGT
jgi:hypothetical protein